MIYPLRLSDISVPHAFGTGYETGIPDHVSHEFVWVSSDAVALQSGSLNRFSKCFVCQKSYVVAVSLELFPECELRPDVAIMIFIPILDADRNPAWSIPTS